MAFTWTSRTAGVSPISLVDFTTIKTNTNTLNADLKCPAYYSHFTSDNNNNSDEDYSLHDVYSSSHSNCTGDHQHKGLMS